MYLAVIGHKRVPSRHGGIEVVVGELATRFARMGIDVDIYNRYTGEEKAKEYNGCRIVEIPTIRAEGYSAVVYSVLATLRACFSKCEVIHYHAEGPCVALPLARIFGKKAVVTVHGIDWKRGKWGSFASIYIHFGEKMAARFANEIIVLSDSDKQYFADAYGRDTVKIVNGIQKIEPLPPNIIRGKYGLEKDGYILFVARITVEKGLDYLLNAFKEIKTDKKLVVVGQLSRNDKYTEHIIEKSKRDERVILTDFLVGNELNELFSNCYLYVLPSDIEGMPISLLEAVSCRARCLTSDVPGNIEAAGDYLHTFRRGDETDLKNKLTELLAKEAEKDTNFGKYSSPEETEKAVKEILSEHDWDAVAEKTADIYKKVLKK